MARAEPGPRRGGGQAAPRTKDHQDPCSALAHHLPGVSTQKPHVRHIITTYSLIEPVTRA